ncbi:MAG: hypothetical protein ACE5FA_01035 [Dehalococcoidia bacterium]
MSGEVQEILKDPAGAATGFLEATAQLLERYGVPAGVVSALIVWIVLARWGRLPEVIAAIRGKLRGGG